MVCPILHLITWHEPPFWNQTTQPKLEIWCAWKASIKNDGVSKKVLLFVRSKYYFFSTPKMMVFRSSERELGLHFCSNTTTIAIPKHIFTTILLGSKPNVFEFATTAVSYELYLLPTLRGLICNTYTPVYSGPNHAWKASMYMWENENIKNI